MGADHERHVGGGQLDLAAGGAGRLDRGHGPWSSRRARRPRLATPTGFGSRLPGAWSTPRAPAGGQRPGRRSVRRRTPPARRGRRPAPARRARPGASTRPAAPSRSASRRTQPVSGVRSRDDELAALPRLHATRTGSSRPPSARRAAAPARPAVVRARAGTAPATGRAAGASGGGSAGRSSTVAPRRPGPAGTSARPRPGGTRPPGRCGPRRAASRIGSTSRSVVSSRAGHVVAQVQPPALRERPLDDRAATRSSPLDRAPPRGRPAGGRVAGDLLELGERPVQRVALAEPGRLGERAQRDQQGEGLVGGQPQRAGDARPARAG